MNLEKIKIFPPILILIMGIFLVVPPATADVGDAVRRSIRRDVRAGIRDAIREGVCDGATGRKRKRCQRARRRNRRGDKICRSINRADILIEILD